MKKFGNFDIIKAFKNIDKNSKILIPDVCLNDDNKFLDDKSIKDLKKIYPHAEVTGSTAKELFDCLKKNK